jgi:hypothetical protein
MTQIIMTYPKALLSARDGRTYTAQAWGREREDANWEGWIEFTPDDDTEVLCSGRETTQPNLVDLEYWATGLTPIYLEGAFERAREESSAAVPLESPPPVITPRSPTPRAVLDPFAAYAQGEDILHRKLGALSRPHLRAIVRDHDLAESDLDLDVLGKPELIALIAKSVRSRA